MYNKLFFLSLLFFVCSCGDKTNSVAGDTENSKKVKLLILLDKSASIHFSPDQTNKLPDDLKGIINNWVGNHSTIGIFFLNSASMSKNFYLNTLQVKEADLSGGGQDIDREKNDFSDRIEKAKVTWRKKIKDGLAIPGTGSTTQETDIWGALSGMESFMAGSENKYVYIYSDMIHSTKSLNHHKSPPKDEEQARNFAANDLPGMLSKYNLNNKSLEGINVRVIFPGDAQTANKNKIMEAYWKTVFKKLGAKDIIFE